MSNIESDTSTSITPVQQMISSCTGAMLTSLIVTPLDVVKIRLQSQQKEFMKNRCFLYCNGLMEHVCYCFNGNGSLCQIHGAKTFRNAHHCYHSLSVEHLTDKHLNDLWYRRPGYFNGTLDALVKITRNEGIASLWSGLPPTLVMAIPATVIYFTLYDQLCEQMRKHLHDTQTKQKLWIPAVAGATARVLAVSVISPLELMRTKMQSKKLSYLEVESLLRQTVRNEGVFSLWKGLMPTLMRDVPFSCLYWYNYERFKRFFNGNEHQVSFGSSFAAGALSGSIAAVLTLPFDVVKTHRQIEIGEQSIAIRGGKTKTKSTGEMMRSIYRQHGYRGLFTGLVPRVSRVAPACAIMISSYESGKAFFRRYNSPDSSFDR